MKTKENDLFYGLETLVWFTGFIMRLLRKTVFIMITVIATPSSYAFDCREIFKNAPAIDCQNLPSHEKSREREVVENLLLRRPGIIDLDSDFAFISKNQLCSDEIKAIKDYSSTTYYTYNSSLRNGSEDTLSPIQQRNICLISKGLEKIPKFKGLTFRGISLTPLAAEKFLRNGNVVTEKAYMSLSKDRQTAAMYSRSDDRTKVGIILVFDEAIGSEISILSNYPLEEEVLADRDNQFKVKMVKQVSNTIYEVHLSQVGF